MRTIIFLMVLLCTSPALSENISVINPNGSVSIYKSTRISESRVRLINPDTGDTSFKTHEKGSKLIRDLDTGEVLIRIDNN
jgi:hypothetical protein